MPVDTGSCVFPTDCSVGDLQHTPVVKIEGHASGARKGGGRGGGGWCWRNVGRVGRCLGETGEGVGWSGVGVCRRGGGGEGEQIKRLAG